MFLMPERTRGDPVGSLASTACNRRPHACWKLSTLMDYEKAGHDSLTDPPPWPNVD